MTAITVLLKGPKLKELGKGILMDTRVPVFSLGIILIVDFVRKYLK